uniref:DUF834 domain-containing protein n=1 Tax=Oryza sativa subsp. japonica TaxID=39947 RepID=Q6YXW9_ORYSJ|nr:hypothetical protein [Oryza sativa Japonica Group]
MTSAPAAARERKLAGERRREDANGRHQRVEGDSANSPVTKTTAEGQRTAPATRKSGGGLRVDGDGGAPVVFGGGEGADEDGDATATTTAVFPSDGDVWNGGGARLERRRRRRR